MPSALEQDACKERKEYDELGIRLKEVLQDLADHIERPAGLIMTKSVKRIQDEIMEEAKRVANKQANKTGRRLIDAMEESDGIMECYRRIDGHLRRITLNASMGALEAIKEHTLVHTGKTCWMNGMAGTGKTTIAYTVCSKLDKSNRLGASFFCSRAIAECRQVKHIIPSIAYQLARFSRPFRRALADVLEEDCDAHTQTLNLQYQKLIIDPLKAVEKSLPEDFIVVIDALDECESLTAVEQILELLLSTTHTLPIRFLISSRPEREITERITGRSNGQDEARLILHNLDSNMVKTDIETYMREELKGIPLEDSELTSIIERSVKVIIDSGSASMEKGDERIIDELYKTILDNAFEGTELNEANRRTMRDVLETAVCATEPMSLDAMASLLQLDSAEQAEALLGPLRSVLNVTKKAKLVTALHASFPDFILSQGRSGNYYCNPNTRHATIAEACLRLIDGAEPKPRSANRPVDLTRLVYACRYWTTHLSLSEHTSSLIGLVHGFFHSRLLLWMEVVNLTKNIRYATSIIQSAEKWCTVGAKRTRTCHKASPRRITVRIGLRQPSRMPKHSAHLRFHASVLAPISATLGSIHAKSIWTRAADRSGDRSTTTGTHSHLEGLDPGNSIEVYDTTTGESVLSLAEERTKNVNCVAISPDGSKVAFSSSDGAAYVWDIANGGTVTQLLPDGVSGQSLTFSPDGSRVACGMANGGCASAHWDKTSALMVRSRVVPHASPQS
ncbi:WD40 repeat-like protein, partial [Rhizoctonia solani]